MLPDKSIKIQIYVYNKNLCYLSRLGKDEVRGEEKDELIKEKKDGLKGKRRTS